MLVCVCGKSYETNSGLKTHQRACIQFNKDKAPFVCICGKEFLTPAHMWNHQKYCKPYCDSVGKTVRDPKKDPNNKNRGKFLRGHSKYEDSPEGELIRKNALIHSEKMKSLGDSNPLVHWNKNKPRDSYERQIQTRHKHYLNNELNLPAGIGRGDTVYFIFHQNKFCLRSSYEFIYALYLAINNIDFEYEAIRIKYGDKLYFSDFSIKNTVIEIKGQKSEKDNLEEKAFTKSGYDFKILYEPDIRKLEVELKKSLKDIVDFDILFEEIHSCSKSRNYYVFDFDEICLNEKEKYIT